jgi:DHA1 family tetracycline resistance protein-like MFS transporter
VVTLLFYFAHHVFSVVYMLYAEHRYGFGPFEVGVMLAFAGALDMAVQGWLTGQVTKQFGDLRTMVIGLIFGSAGLLAMGLAPSGWLFVAALLPNALWGLALPTLLSLMTQRVSERDQGQIQGASNSVASLAGVASPLFFGWVYSLSAAGSGLSFYIAAAILACAAGIGLATAGAGAPAKT